jgi:phosphoribosylformimino-5-aminoimidazole carboxamide ribotide isomerase
LNDLLSTQVVSRLIGVVDLKDGQAVHAIAGVRNEYKPVQFCSGDPQRLVTHYLQIGVAEFYIADLDAITVGAVQLDLLRHLCQLTGNHRTLLDIGWAGLGASKLDRERARSITELSTAYPATRWIAAIESMPSLNAVKELTSLVPGSRLLIGFDYNHEKLIGKIRMDDWIDIGLSSQVSGAVILDLAQVGSQSGPTTGPHCQLVKDAVPDWTIFSGGGIRNARDVENLTSAGCERCLVGTALHGIV